MKAIQSIIGALYTWLLFTIYITDKMICLLRTKYTPSFDSWAFDERGKLHRQNSTIRVLTILFLYLMYTLIF